MNKFRLVLFALVMVFTKSIAQNKSGNTVIFGGGGVYATFNNNLPPVTGQIIPPFSNPNFSDIFTNGASNICDSATGALLMFSNGYVLYDAQGGKMENGDSLVPSKIFHLNSDPQSPYSQGSLILPKGSNGLYYVFTNTITDSMYDYWFTNPFGDGRFPANLLQYHVIDMNANNGLGKVVQKNVALLTNVEMSKVGMMACRHANGYDWWLLKQALDTNLIYTFLVTKDTVVLDTIQGFSAPHFGYLDLQGQSCFSTDGSKYAFIQSTCNKLFVADFDRCYGILSTPKVYTIPIDSTTFPNPPPQYIWDSISRGVCFSPNDSFIYITREFNIYQFDINNSDSASAWYRVKHGEDTTLLLFAEYGQLYKGLDNKIYIGKAGGQGSQNSVIDYPNNKGGACGFCRKCIRYDSTDYFTFSFANMPDFNLGKKEPCWPLSNGEILKTVNEILVYPNPTSGILYFEITNPKYKNSKVELYNVLGQLLRSEKIQTNKKSEIDISNLSNGIYYLRCVGICKKIIKE